MNTDSQTKLPGLIFVIAICAAVLATGCASSSSGGRAHNPDNLNKIVQGVTTKAEVESLVGKPSGMIRLGDGTEIWTYSANDFHAKMAKRTGIMALGQVGGAFLPGVGTAVALGTSAGTEPVSIWWTRRGSGTGGFS